MRVTNYFRVRGDTKPFFFDESDIGTLFVALDLARHRAKDVSVYNDDPIIVVYRTPWKHHESQLFQGVPSVLVCDPQVHIWEPEKRGGKTCKRCRIHESGPKREREIAA